MVGILVSFWDGLFSGAMLVLGSVTLIFFLLRIVPPISEAKPKREIVTLAGANGRERFVTTTVISKIPSKNRNPRSYFPRFRSVDLGCSLF